MKIIKILTISFCIIFILSHSVFALGDIFSMGESWEETGKEYAEEGNTINTDKINKMSSDLYNMLLAIATVVAVIVGAILGIQFMTAGIDKKVEVKQALFPYLISCIVVFGSLGIWKLVVTIMKQI